MGYHFTRGRAIDSFKTEDQARDYAIEWQKWSSQRSLSYGELHEWQLFFTALAKRFNNLTEEFSENGVI